MDSGISKCFFFSADVFERGAAQQGVPVHAGPIVRLHGPLLQRRQVTYQGTVRFFQGAAAAAIPSVSWGLYPNNVGELVGGVVRPSIGATE